MCNDNDDNKDNDKVLMVGADEGFAFSCLSFLLALSAHPAHLQPTTALVQR